MGNVKAEEMPRSEPVSLLVGIDHDSGEGPESNETKQPESHLSVIRGQEDSRTECADSTSSVEIETDHQGRLMNDSRTGGTHDNSDEEPSQSTGSNPMVGDSKNDHLEPARLSDGQQSQEANSVVNSLINNDNGKHLPSVSAHQLKTSELTLPLFDVGSSLDGFPVMLDGVISSSSKVNNAKTGDAKNEDHVSQITDLTAHHRKMIRSAKSFSPSQEKEVDLKRGLIERPFESVKEAVSRFGGTVDWKALRNQTLERSKLVEQVVVRVPKEKREYKKRSDNAEEEKMNVLKELDSTKKLTEKLKLHLERAQTEANQAKQDYELAKFRVEEMEQGIGDEASVAARAQLEVAKARHAAAVSELKFVKEKLETLNKEYALLKNEKDTAVKKAEEVVSASKEVEKMVEELTTELIATRKILESAHAAHVEAEEKRIRVTLARDRDTKHWEKELKRVEEDLQRLNQEIYSAKDLKSKLDFASVLLLDLKAELASYMEYKLKEDIDGHPKNKSQTSKTTTHIDVHAFVASLQKELEDAKVNIEKARAEVDCLKVATISLKLELDRDKSELANIKQREGMASSAVALSEAELATVTRAADEAKSLAEMAREDLHKAEEEAAQAKAGASAMESRLLAAEKEIEAAKTAEKLALAAIEAFEKGESTKSIDNVDSPPSVTLSIEEYYDLSKRANEAEEEAKMRVEAAVSQVEVAKQSELISLNRLEEVSREMAERKEALKVAMVKAEKAGERKFGIEQEWRKWRDEPKATELSQGENPPRPSSEGKKETNNFKPKDIELSQGESQDENSPRPSSEGKKETNNFKPKATELSQGESQDENLPKPSSEGKKETNNFKPKATELSQGESQDENPPRPNSEGKKEINNFKPKATELSQGESQGENPPRPSFEGKTETNNFKPKATELSKGENPPAPSSEGKKETNNFKPKAIELSRGENPSKPSSEGKKETNNFKPNILARSKTYKQGNTTETQPLPKPKHTETQPLLKPKLEKKKKKSTLPKIFTLFSWKKSHSSSSKGRN